jgi:cytokinin riboside 5'-monophosphate phosphoribohydrolase
MAMDAAVAVKSGGGGAGSTGVTAAASQSPQAATNGGERRSRFQRICVYCGSAKGRKPSYQDAAVELGKELVRASPETGPLSPSPKTKPARPGVGGE